MKKSLNVKAVPDRLQPNFEAFEAGVRRFVGRKFDPTAGEVDSRGEAQGGFVILPEGESVSLRAEYIKAVKDGDLLPADAETAKLCGVPFSAAKPAK